jgi:hypothetical protein
LNSVSFLFNFVETKIMANIVYRPRLPVGYDPAPWKEVRAQWVADHQSLASTMDFQEWHVDRMKDFLEPAEQTFPISWLFGEEEDSAEEVNGPEEVAGPKEVAGPDEVAGDAKVVRSRVKRYNITS